MGEKTRRLMGRRGWYSRHERTSSMLRQEEKRRAQSEAAEEINSVELIEADQPS